MRSLINISKIFVFVLLVFTTFVNQKIYSQILIGPKAGLSFGVLSISDQVSSATNSYRIGFLVGGVVEFRINDMFSIQAEPAYNQKGSDISFNPGGYQVETKNRFGYLQIPLTFKVRLELLPLTPYVTIGPNVGFLLSAKAESNFISPTPVEYDEMSNYKKTDFAIDLGTGCEYRMSPSLIYTADIRYSLGIFNIHNVPDGGSVKTRGIQILLGLLTTL